MELPFSFTSTTRSRVICGHGAHFGGALLISKNTVSAVTIGIANSGTSKGFAGLSGSTLVVPVHTILSTDSPYELPAPIAGIRCSEGIFLYLPTMGGVSCVVWWR
jgi:hypothetical protein